MSWRPLPSLPSLLADVVYGPRPWWPLAVLLAAVGAVLIVVGLRRRRRADGVRRCPRCGFDLRSTPARRCGECGYEAPSEAALRRGGRRWVVAALGVAIIVAVPACRGVSWSRARGWSPPLPPWRTDFAVDLAGGGRVEHLVPRDPRAFGQRVRVRGADGSARVLEGYRLRLDGTVGGDVTGDEIPDVVVTEFSGGAHCCTTLHVLSLPPRGGVRVAATVELNDGGRLEDVDDDEVFEIVTRDWSLAYDLTCFACLEYPRVVLAWTGDGYAVAPSLMRRPAPDDATLADRARRLRELDWQGAPERARDAVWSAMLELIYAGHADRSDRLLDAAWGGDIASRDAARADLRRVVDESPYRDAIASRPPG